MNVANWLAATARQQPGSPALLKGTTVEADYEEFARRASSIAACLRQEFNVAAGDRVALFMSNCTEYLECLYGIWWAGAVAVPVNAKLHPKEAAWIFENSQACLVFADGEKAQELFDPALALASLPRIVPIDGYQREGMLQRDGEPTPAVQERDDLAWLFYTSGTTGRPKGVMLSHGNLIAMSLCYPVDIDPVSPEDAILYAAPISHGAGLCNFIHVRLGARHVVPESGGFDAGEVLALGKHLRNVSLFAAPTMVKRLVEAARRNEETGDGLKTIVYGGAPMYVADMLDALSVMGSRFTQIYGQGESPMTITSLPRQWHTDTGHPRYTSRLASVGRAQSAVEVRVTDAAGLALPAGETGEIEVKGATVMRGYWRDPDATAGSLKNGWLRTGDVGKFDVDGFLTLSDRSKDVIISGGSNIYPREVEEALLTHPQVREVSVVGAADPDWGEVVVACVVLEDNANVSDAALGAHCLASIARFKRPKRYVRLSELPKNNYGKVLKTALRQAVATQSFLES